MFQHQTYKGIFLRICGTGSSSVVAVLIKKIGGSYPLGEIIFARSIFMVFPVFAMLIAQGDILQGIKTKNPWMHFSRVSTGVISMFCVFGSLSYLSLPDVTAIGFAAPLFTVAFSVFMLREKVRFYRWTAVIAGFVGVAIIFSPHIMRSFAGTENGTALLGSLLALAGAIFSAFSMISIRKMAKTEGTSVIVFYFAIGATVMSLFTLPFGWVRPTPIDGAILVILGLAGGMTQLLITQSYRYTEASVVAPFDYIVLLWAIIFGWFFFAEAPSWQMLGGAALVIVSGIYVIWREHGTITAMQEAMPKP